MYIPGLSYVPAEDPQAGIHIPSFRSTDGFIPESLVYGNCQPVRELEELSTIYEGEYGKVCKCREKSKLYALKELKMFSMENGIPTRILREANSLKMFKKHENIVHYVKAVAGKGLDSNYLLLEYCPYSLNDCMKENMSAIYAIDSVKYVMKQLFEGLAYIHHGMVLHRNITCSNILFDDKGILKIAGFRTSRAFSKGDMTPQVTELIYRAPELLLGTKKYGPAVDMWSVGCVFASLLLRKPLFTGNSELEVLHCICDVLGTPSETIWPGFKEFQSAVIIVDARPFSTINRIFRGVPKLSFDLVSNLLIYNPKARLSSTDCLRSPFFKEPEVCSPETFLKNVLRGASMEVDR